MTDFRSLCAELFEELAAETSLYPGHEREIVTRARAALAEPEPEGPTDEDLWDIGERHLWTGTDESTIAYDRILTSFITAARAVLARWGNYPASPDSSTPQPIPVTERLPGPLVDSEVAELVAWLNDHAYVLNEHGARIVRRAVDLLKQLPPRPISVTERLPGCDGEEQFWWFFPGDNEWWLDPYPLSSAYNTCTHWLPANAIPNPRSEND